MKFNWGTGIFLFYGLFAMSLFYQVYRSTQYDNSLVVDNYYEEDIKYQQQYERLANAQTLGEPVRIAYTNADRQVVITFPREAGEPSGRVTFYRPSDKRFDFAKDIAIDENGQMIVPAQSLLGGRWKVKVLWSAAGKDYFAEEELMLP